MGTVTQIGGRSYLDIDTVAQIMNGTVTVEPNRILLVTTAREASPNATAAAVQPRQGLSKDFARASIAELAEMREWRGAVGAILSYGSPVVGSWPQDYRADRVQASLEQAAVAATSRGRSRRPGASAERVWKSVAMGQRCGFGTPITECHKIRRS